MVPVLVVNETRVDAGRKTENDYYWYLVGVRHGRQEALEVQVEDLREIQRLVGGRIE